MDPFVWDEAKNAENIRARGISFDLVLQIDWSRTAFEDDLRFDYGERRIRLATRIDGKPYLFALVPRDGTIRVISARRMHEKEAETYDI